MSTSTFALPTIENSEQIGKFTIPEVSFDSDTLICVCGEYTFMETNKDGSAPAMVDIHLICFNCGCMYSVKEMSKKNTATVITQFDVDSDEFDAAVVSYYKTKG